MVKHTQTIRQQQPRNYQNNDENIRIMFQIWSKLTIKTPQRRQLRRSNVFLDNSEQILHIL